MKATALCGIRGVTWMTGIESEFVKPLGQRDIPALGKPDRSRLFFQPVLKSEPHRPLPKNSRLWGFLMFNSQLKKELEDQRAELAMLRQLTQQMDRGMLSIRLNSDFCISAVNQDFANALGHQPEQLLGRPLSDIVPPYVSKLPCFHNFNKAMAEFAPVSDNYRYLSANGPLVWLNVHWFPVRGEDGKLAYVQGYARDVTETLEGAKESEAFIDALIRSTAVIQFNLDGTVITANNQFQQAMGYRLNELVGQHHRKFCTPEEANSPEYDAFWRKLNS